MPYSTTLTKKGQITIPKTLRDILRLKENSRIILEIEKDKKTIKIKPAFTILDLAGKFKPKKIENAIKLRKKIGELYQPR